MNSLPHSALVTGASSGIGKATALKLAGEGWKVFAAVRRVDSAPKHENIIPVAMDVGDQATISTATGTVKRVLEGKGLDALVNVAGIGQAAPMEYVPMEKLQEIFNVNVFGLVAVTQAFLPLVREAKGRIVNISSIGALITIPFGGALCATKRSVEAITDALRMELLPAGIHVIAIRPASIHTPAVGKLADTEDAVVNSLPLEGRERYGEAIRHFIREACASEMKGSPPEAVAETIFTALTDAHPHTHYLSGKSGHLLSFLGKWLPDSLRDHVLLTQLGLPHDFGKEAGEK